MRLYHILSSKFAKSDLLRKHLHVSRFHELNDPFECCPFESISELQQTEKKAVTDVFGLLCFSSTYSDPAMWAHYGQRHRGICLGFDVLEPHPFPVTYSKSRLASPIGSILNFQEYLTNVVVPFITTKSESWNYENEFRLILNLSQCSKSGDHYFYPFSNNLDLKEIILGYSYSGSLDRVHWLADRIGQGISIFRSTLSDNRFEMIKTPLYCPPPHAT